MGLRVYYLTKYIISIAATFMIFSATSVKSFAWTNLGGGDHAGADWTISSNTAVAGVHTNIGVFTVDTGITATVQAYDGASYGTFEVSATTVSIVGTITAASKGYLGVVGADGQGPGGGGYRASWHAGGGGYGGVGASSGATAGPTYGSFVNPVSMGSAGGSNYNASNPGGNGGGAIIITSSGTTTVSGTISTNGGDGIVWSGGGSGGTVNITAATFAGSGTITANGGAAVAGGGGGRIAIKYSTANTFNGTITATAGSGGDVTVADNGTLIYLDTTNNDLLINSTQTWSASPTLEGSVHTYRNVTLTNSSTLTLKGYTTSSTEGVGFIFNTSNFTVDTGSTIRTRGFEGVVAADGQGPGGGGYRAGWHAGGGGHGGAGGTGGATAGTTYGSSINPVTLGSAGGGNYNGTNPGGKGGGAVKIIATDTVTISGTISSNGYDGVVWSGGGSGGSVYIRGVSFTGGGTISANGGASGTGGGGGGRIAVYYVTTTTWSGTMTASGGSGDTAGSAGSIVYGLYPRGDAYDSSGNGLNSKLNGFLDSDWKPGKFGQALTYDGSSKYLSVADPGASSLLDFDTGSSITLEAWVYPESLPSSGNYVVILDKGSTIGTDSSNYMLKIGNSSGNYVISFCFIQASGTSKCYENSTSVIQLNTWQHIGFSYTFGTGSTAQIYYNGISQSGSWVSGTGNESPTVQNNSLWIGADNISGGGSIDQAFTGRIDEIKIYNYSRSSGQIIEDLNAGHPAPGSPVGSATTQWSFDEGNGTTAFDSSSNADNLTLSTTSWTNDGKFGKAWNGTGAIWISRANDPDLDFSASDSFTISGWFKSDSATNPANGTEYILSTSSGNTDVGYQVYAKNTGVICFGIDDDGTWTDVESCTTDDYYDGNWHHFTAVRDVSADTTNIYIDGALKDSDTDITTGTLDGDNVFYLGDFDGDNNATAGIEEFAGDLDEFKVYRLAMNADQVKAEYNQGSAQVMGSLSTTASGAPSNSATDSYCPPGQGSTCVGPVAHWKLDENNGNSVYDTSGNNNSGSWNGTLGNQWTAGKFGSAGKFNGSDNYISTSNGNSVKGLSQFTVELWFNASALDGTQNSLYTEARNVDNSKRVNFSIDTDNQLVLIGRTDDSTTVTYVNDTRNLNINTWYHVAAVFDSVTDTHYIYLNGVPLSNSVAASSFVNTNPFSPPNIGSQPGSGQNFPGKIDDVRFYNYARTPAQIAWDYNRGGPVAWWQMDETSWNGTAGEIKDASGNGYNGTANGSATTTTGKINNAGIFNGSNNGAATDSTVDLSGTDKITLAFWLNWDAYANDDDLAMELSANMNSNNGAFMVDPNASAPCNGEFAFTMNYSSNRAESIPRPSAGAWHHYAVVYDLSSVSGDITVYLDGVLQNSTVCANFMNGPGTFGNYVLYFMGRANSTLRGAGKLDDVRIYNYVLNPTQVKLIMNDNSAIKFAQ